MGNVNVLHAILEGEDLPLKLYLNGRRVDIRTYIQSADTVQFKLDLALGLWSMAKHEDDQQVIKEEIVKAARD